MNKLKMQGFTLMELMIIVVIVAILATIAYPSYDTFIRRSRMEQAKASIMAKSRDMERLYTKARSFTDANHPASAPASTDFFTIGFVGGVPQSDSYEIFAKPTNKNPNETQGIYFNSIGTTMSRCDANTIDQSGSRTNCEPY